MNKYIENILDEYEYPIINSILFSNGDMLVLRSYFIGSDYKVRVLCKSTIDSYFDYNDKNAVSNFEVPIHEENESYSSYAGEGSWGGDGVMYVMDKVKQEFVWFLFLDNCNPFEEIVFDTSDTILACTSEVKLRIPIKDPAKISSV